MRHLWITFAVGIAFGGTIYYLSLPASDPPHILATYPTEGVLLYRGKPLAGARVTFVPEEHGKTLYKPVGSTAADGSYKLSTFRQGDGAPVGRYKILVRWTSPRAENPFLKYADPESTTLRAVIANTTLNQIEPFDLEADQAP